MKTADKLFLALVLIALNLFLTLFFEYKLATTLKLEFIVLGVVFIASMVALVGTYFDKEWAPALLAVLFGISIVNAIYLFVVQQALITFLALLVCNIAGVFFAVYASREPEEMFPSLETYDLEESANVELEFGRRAGRRRR